MASVEQHGNGWRAVWRDGGRGSTPRKGETFGSKRQAEKDARRISAERKASKPMHTGRAIGWDELIARYCLRLKDDGHTAHKYPERVKKTLTKLVASREWKSTADVIPGAVGTLNVPQHRMLKAVLRFAQLLNQRVDPRCIRLKPPNRRKRAVRPLATDEQVALLLAQAARYSPWMYAAGHLSDCYGHRPETLVNLEVEDAELDATPPTMVLKVKYGDHVRHELIPATVAILRPLVAGRAPKDRLLLTAEGKVPYPSGSRLAERWYYMVGKVAVPSHPDIKQLKRRAITRMLSDGLDPATIISITGHRSKSVILTYNTTNQQQQRRALASIAARHAAMPAAPPQQQKG